MHARNVMPVSIIYNAIMYSNEMLIVETYDCSSLKDIIYIQDSVKKKKKKILEDIK